MVIRTLFELESIKDQLALIESLISHLSIEDEITEADIKKILTKLNNHSKNLTEKLELLKKNINN